MSDLEARLQAILDAYVAKGITGVTVALRLPGRATDILLASGIADRANGTAMTPEHTFRIGSCTKTFVAAALHQLVEEGEGVPRNRRCSTWCASCSTTGAACRNSKTTCR